MVTNSNEYMRAYYSKNKDKYRTKYNPEHFCTVCNCTMKIKNRGRHVKTKKHLDNLAKMNSTEEQKLNEVKHQIKQLLDAVQTLEGKNAPN